MKRVIGTCMLLAVTAAGQQFEVASVKVSKAAEGASEGLLRARDSMYESMPAGFLPIKGATVTAHDRTLAQLIGMAYRIKPSAVTGPGWITELRYDVDAKLPEGASAKESNGMLRRLLEERFGLRTHTETKTTGGYALVVGKDGAKLTPSTEPTGVVPGEEELRKRARERTEQMMEKMRKSGGMQPGYSSWGSSQATSAQIAENVGRMIQAPVVDETGLTGKYAVEIVLLAGETPDETPEYRMTLALAKLGLKLESRKTEVTKLIVDAASKTPTEN